MNSLLLFIVNSILLGVGLAMDAFSVSMANGLHEPQMSAGKQGAIALTFAAFQFVMPMIGWICVHTIVEIFTTFQQFIPWIALGLLGYIGGKMLWEGLHEGESSETSSADVSLKINTLMLQGVATSIDALSVGFTISSYSLSQALGACLLIAVTTLAICLAGVQIGQRFGTKLAGKASILGGVILIGIGLEIFITSWI